MFTSLGGSYNRRLSCSSGFYSFVKTKKKKKTLLEISAQQKTSTTSSKSLFCLAAPHRLIHIHFLIPPFSSFAPPRTPVYSCHRPAFIRPASAVSCLHGTTSPNKLTLYFENQEKTATVFLPIIFLSRSNVGQCATWPTPVGVCHIYATLSAQVWLMAAAICRPILPVAFANVSSSHARARADFNYVYFVVNLGLFGLFSVFFTVCICKCDHNLLFVGKKQPTGMRD